jgi:O-antigen/teichoic acid export membrane protein
MLPRESAVSIGCWVLSLQVVLVALFASLCAVHAISTTLVNFKHYRMISKHQPYENIYLIPTESLISVGCRILCLQVVLVALFASL